MKVAFIFHGTEGNPEENWFPWMKQKIQEQGYEVIVPQFPTPPEVPAKISEWFDVLKQYESKIREDSIIIGHSLGGKFALRVLEKLDHPIKIAAFVGTPIGIPPIANNERDNAFTDNNFDWASIKSKAQDFIVFQSDNDPYVGHDNGTELAAHLGTELSFVPGAGHFNKVAGYTAFEALLQELLTTLKI